MLVQCASLLLRASTRGRRCISAGYVLKQLQVPAPKLCQSFPGHRWRQEVTRSPGPISQRVALQPPSSPAPPLLSDKHESLPPSLPPPWASPSLCLSLPFSSLSLYLLFSTPSPC